MKPRLLPLRSCIMVFNAVLWIFCLTSSQTITSEHFETGLPTSASSTAASCTLSSGVWTVYKTAQDAGQSGYGAKMSSNSSAPGYLVSPSLNTVAMVTYYAKSNASTSTMTIQKSTDGGVTFTSIATQTITSTYTQYSLTVNESGADVRIKFLNTPGSGTSQYIDEVVLTGIAPNIINLSSASLSNFNAVVAGQYSVSQSYTVSGNYLTADLKIIAPQNFQISLDDMTYSDSLVLVPSSGTIAGTKIYVRFAPTTANGSVEATILHSSAGASDKSVVVFGAAIAAEPTIGSAISFGTVTGNSVVVNFSGGNGMGRMLVARADSAVSFIPSDGSDMNGVSANYTSATNQGSGNKIVLLDTATSVIVSGLTPGTTYYFSAFEYNVGTGSSQNYLTTSVSTSSIKTTEVAGLAVSLSSLTFTNVLVNAISSEQSYTLSGVFLFPTTGTVSLKAPAQFQISTTSGSGFDTVLLLPYSSATLNATIYVRFAPTVSGYVSGSIVQSGGGADAQSVAVSGNAITKIIAANSPIGFASLNGGTTGGAGGDSITVLTASEFLSAIGTDDNPLIIYVSGIMQISGTVTCRSNKSIIGLGTDAKITGGGLELYKKTNVVFRNLAFEDAQDDCLKLNQGTTNIWIDHCSFSDGATSDPEAASHDGLIDITRTTNYITVSYCYFTNHSKAILVGMSDGYDQDKGYLKTTFHHNWFNGTRQRNPRLRYGQVHCFNNLYQDNELYSVASVETGEMMMEGNYFLNVPYPSYSASGYADSGPGYLVERNNLYINSGTPEINGTVFEPSTYYSYSVDSASTVPATVTAQAGSGKVTIVDAIETHNVSAPVSFALNQNYPNPFNPSTKIQYSIAKTGLATLKVYDVLGRELSTLVNSVQTTGQYYVQFDASHLASGVYFAILRSNEEQSIIKMLLMK
jgi:pectate lyase